MDSDSLGNSDTESPTVHHQNTWRRAWLAVPSRRLAFEGELTPPEGSRGQWRVHVGRRGRLGWRHWRSSYSTHERLGNTGHAQGHRMQKSAHSASLRSRRCSKLRQKRCHCEFSLRVIKAFNEDLLMAHCAQLFSN